MALGRVEGWLLVPLALSSFYGCGQAESRAPSGSAGTSATGGGDASASGGAAQAAGVNGGGGAASSADPTLCGGAYEVECAADKLCLFDRGTCGTAASCVRKPNSCDNIAQPTCGCDGKTYGNECEARSTGVSPQHERACDEAQIECGPYRCAKSQYCLDKGPSGDMPWRYACLALPATCVGEPSCACLGTVKACFSGSACAVTGPSVTVTCN